MEIKILKTFEISDSLWTQITKGFNESFGLDVSQGNMKEAFCIRNRNGYGYHAVALSDEGELMGYNVFSPVYYKNGLKTVVSGSTYVRPKFRTHEMLFMEMVNALRKAVISDGYEVEIGVPNHNSERFALKILKFKLVAELNYYILPFNVSRSLNKPGLKFLDGFVNALSRMHLVYQKLTAAVFNTKEKDVKYEIDLDDEYWKYRFSGDNYHEGHEGDFHAYWLPYAENGAKAVYLMDFREDKKRSYRALVRAINMITKQEQVDIILFVGFLQMKQHALLKCPKRFIPKRLPFTYYVLNKKEREKYEDMGDVRNWNFSLMNFDVR